ncbi:hypothetical protein E8L90_11405 [Brevibacillus antibioticus]|uniref:YtkA-like domain-containing protein n=1 Tax=Brevibacillus antibioticus TaxID=2570228 RepID=A0A4U2Y785_9BACL|nr:hypothetical protein [Brevibacillus antibioticus]TKI56015.1 hypothetical protein E8L90_11405 [Brevibacillus antibioticus]
MKIKRFLFRLFLLIAIAGGVEWFVYANQQAQTEVVADESHAHHAAPTLAVTHTLEKDDLQLKLTVTNFSFSLENMGKENKHGEGHVHLYLDGKKIAKVFEPSYVMKDIPAGKHEVKVELAHNNHESYGVAESFSIEVKP